MLSTGGAARGLNRARRNLNSAPGTQATSKACFPKNKKAQTRNPGVSHPKIKPIKSQKRHRTSWPTTKPASGQRAKKPTQTTKPALIPQTRPATQPAQNTQNPPCQKTERALRSVKRPKQPALTAQAPGAPKQGRDAPLRLQPQTQTQPQQAHQAATQQHQQPNARACQPRRKCRQATTKHH